MLTTDVQERIMDVFSRANESLSKEIQEINIVSPFQERLALYEAIETDFKGYSLLGKDLVTEVKSNITSDLRPAERERYITNLQSFLNRVRDGYDYLESDEWVDKIFTDFKTMMVFGPPEKRLQLTEGDTKYIYKIAEGVRVCCYEYVKAVDELNAESRDPIPHLVQNFGYVNRFRKTVVPQPREPEKPIAKEDQPKNTNAKLEWKGDKTDLAELVWALFKSNRILDTTTGQPVTQKELTRHFETLLSGLTLDVTGLMKGRMNTYKATSDGNTFTKVLFELVNERAANS